MEGSKKAKNGGRIGRRKGEKAGGVRRVTSDFAVYFYTNKFCDGGREKCVLVSFSVIHFNTGTDVKILVV